MDFVITQTTITTFYPKVTSMNEGM